MVRSLGIEAPGRFAFFEYEDGPPPAGCFRLATLYSGFSAGTELTFAKGSNPYLRSAWDAERCVFDGGAPGTDFPLRFLGYMEVGRVDASASAIVRDGDVIAMAYGHKTAHTADPRGEFFAPLPADLDPLLGIYVAQMGPICANALLHAAADLVGSDVRELGDGVRGRRVLTVGGGVVGLLTSVFARQHGAAEVAIADAAAFRRTAAERMGFTAVDEAEAWRFCKERWRHGSSDRGADVVFQCRARAASLQVALRALRPQGTVIDLAFYQGGADELRLGEEFHHNGLAIRCAQIGHVPRGLGFVWTKGRLASETVALLSGPEGRLVREHVITDVVPLDDAPAFLADLLAHRRDFLQIVFRVAP